MKKRNLYKYFILIFLFLVAGKMSFAQTYNNEWIVYGKPYYKFKILNDGIYRITGATLSSLGISTTGAQLQLWRNGIQVPIYVNNSGTLGSADYIEFYGQHNDGSVDAGLFQQPSDQLNKGKCFETDSCTYFLTINTTTTQNLRFNDNGAPSSTGGLTPEPYFMYTVQNNLGTTFNWGPAQQVSGQPVYSSDYQYKTYGVSIGSGSSTNTAFSNLFPYTTSNVSSTFSVGVAGSSNANRTVNVSLSSGGTIINGQTFTGYGGQATGTGFQITGNITATIQETSSTGDNCVVSFASLTYPRLYNFNNQSFFAFNLKASTAQRLLQITNFAANGSTPVLYDVTHAQKYTALVSGSNYQFVLPAMDSAALVMAAQSASSYTSITASQITQRNFVDVTNTSNQGNFLIITHPTLLTGAQSYQQYRTSATGGSYNVKIYTIEDLEDEFAFGIRNHPLSVKNFILYARNKFAAAPQYVFIIGHGLTFDQTFGTNGSNPLYQAQALVPTFGTPASDILLAANAFTPIAAIPVGRLSAVSNQEITNYLAKVQSYEQLQQTNDYTIANNLWKKNMAYVAGGGSAVEEPNFASSLSSYEQIMQDTLFGGFGYDFANYPGSFSTQSPNAVLSGLFTNGMSFISYYGHGSSTVIGYTSLSSPSSFTYTGKYPVIFTSGCDLGACFSYVAGRTTALTNMTELYLLTPNVGAVGFVAQTYLGVTGILDQYDIPMYRSLSGANYGKAIPFSMVQGQNAVLSSNNILNLANAAQTVFLGDPSISLYHFSKPDFAVEASQIIMPATASITDANYSVKVYLYNIGQYVRAQDSVLVQIQKTSPSGSKTTLLSKYIPSISYKDSVQITVPINPNTDAGNNTITVTIDGDHRYDEITYSNNSASQSIQIYSNGITPVYPYNYAIIHNSTQHLFASTSNALAASAAYVLQIDTTVLFNSPALVTKNITSIGGVLEFNPGITYTDSTVYYWRTSPAPSAATNNLYNWASSSFQYIGSPNISDGLGQSHVYQHLADSLNGLNLDSTGNWSFGPRPITVVVNHALEGNGGVSNWLININNATKSSYYSTVPGNSIMFNVFDPNSFYPYLNESPVPSTTQYVSNDQLGGYLGSTAGNSSPYSYNNPPYYSANKGNFQFPIQTLAQRNTVVQFMNWIPDGAYVVARIFVNNATTMPYVSTWQADGTDTSTLYAHFIGQGLTTINDFISAQPLFFIYKKNGHGFTPYQELNVTSRSINVNASDSIGYATSPIFGPALQWTSMQWNGRSLENPSTANAQVSIIGYDSSKTIATTLTPGLLPVITTAQANIDISSIPAAKYPYLQLMMRDADSTNFTPYQLRYWHLLYMPVPEGALAPNANPGGMSDTINAGQDYKFSIAFKNISDQPFADSIIGTAKIVSANNSTYNIPVPNLKKLSPGDTSTVFITIPGDTSTYNQTIKNPLFKATVPTTSLTGANTISLNINPKFAQPEETLDNNNLIKNLFVKSNTGNTLLDVTFDGIHILNNDIVAAKPDIQIHLTSSSKYILLTDTSVVQVSLKFPDGTTHRYYFSNSDTLSFTPAKDSADNEALVNLRPYLTQDGTYQLIVTGVGGAISQSYTVSFQVINKPMISDMFNYPNPFTSSTAFLFTITGSVVPQNIRIEILTITGKIVKEITEAELGPLHVGRNLTSYKWDGTDMYGQKLANGTYLFRVITNEDGKSLDKYNLTDQNGNQINTGKYFNKGYGKMYLMR